MTSKPPPFKGYAPVVSDDIWAKIRTGEIQPHVYSSEAKGDFEPIAISPAEFFRAEDAGRDEDGDVDPLLEPYQIMWRDRDRRRPSATRRAIPVPHWVYVAQVESVERAKAEGRRGRLPKADWDAFGMALRDEIRRRGLPNPENDDPTWRIQAHVERWAADFLEDRQEHVGEATVRERVKKVLAEMKAGK